jgi:hypothetical protein
MATDLVAPTVSATQDQGSGIKRSFRGLFSEVRPFNASILEDSIAADTGATCDITVAGAAIGDFVLLAPGVDITGCEFSAFVSAANTVTVNFWNPEGTDANTSMSAATVFNGLVLRPDPSVWAELA